MKKKKKLSKGGLVLIIGLTIILIPTLIFAGILLKASLQTGEPVNGDRFENDLDPAITKNDMDSLESKIKALPDVENVSIVLTTANFRVNVDVKDSLSEEDMSKVAESVYQLVDTNLPVSAYFTAHNGMKMYDLSINIYNFIDSENEKMIYVLLTKNSKMEEYKIEVPSKPKDPELVKDLKGESADNEGSGE